MLNILSGIKTANIVSLPAKEGVVFDQGDWVVFTGDSNQVEIQSGGLYQGDKGVILPVYAGNKNFYDPRYLGRIDCVTAKSGVLETDKYSAGSQGKINAGEALVVENGALVPRTGAEDTDETNRGKAPVVGYALAETTKNSVLKFMLA